MKSFIRWTLGAGLAASILLLWLAGCGGGGSSRPSSPTGLSATGSLGVIRLAWTDAGPLIGHNIYRSTDNVTFEKRNGARVAGSAFSDNIASPEGDGIYYYYRVTAVGDEESAPSPVVRAMHGTRLLSAYPAGFTSDPLVSPYVLDNTTVVDGGNFEIHPGDKLYVLDNAVLDIEQGNMLFVRGLLRVLASSGANHATFTSHRNGGPLALGEGLWIWLDMADDFNPSDNSGTLIRNTLLTNLRSGQAIQIDSCSPRIENCRAVSNIRTGGSAGTSYLSIGAGANPVVRNCSFDFMTLEMVSADVRDGAFRMEHNVFTNSYYSASFWLMAAPGLDPGQIAQNVFDGSKTTYLYNVTGAETIPLDNNYWSGGSGNPPTPSVTIAGTTTAGCSFAPALNAAPAGVGPDW